jgi:hypothetical protein
LRLGRLPLHRLKAPKEKLREALRGRVTHHRRFLLQLHLGLEVITLELKVEIL